MQPYALSGASLDRRVIQQAIVPRYPTVTDLARLRGLSMLRPSLRAEK